MCGPIFFSVISFIALELFVLIELGSVLGGFNTVFLVAFGGVLGLYIAQSQGLESVRRMQSQGVVPTSADVLEGPLLIAAALCLLLPGFLSDTVGAVLLVPPLRRFIARRIVARFGGGPGSGGTGGRPNGPDDDMVIVVKRRGKS